MLEANQRYCSESGASHGGLGGSRRRRRLLCMRQVALGDVRHQRAPLPRCLQALRRGCVGAGIDFMRQRIENCPALRPLPAAAVFGGGKRADHTRTLGK